jgi:hypothetical protein
MNYGPVSGATFALDQLIWMKSRLPGDSAEIKIV